MFLLIDSATFGCHVALCNSGGDIVASRSKPVARGHAEHMPPMFRDVMAEAGFRPDAVQSIVVTIGPGSFTGLRVGLSFAQALGYALNIPVEGITTFQAFSASLGPAETRDRTIVLDTRRDDFYMQPLDAAHNPKADAVSVGMDKALEIIQPGTIVAGDAAALLAAGAHGLTGECDIVPQESLSLPLVCSAVGAGMVQTGPARAFYIRDADVGPVRA